MVEWPRDAEAKSTIVGKKSKIKEMKRKRKEKSR